MTRRYFFGHSSERLFETHTSKSYCCYFSVVAGLLLHTLPFAMHLMIQLLFFCSFFFSVQSFVSLSNLASCVSLLPPLFLCLSHSHTHRKSGSNAFGCILEYSLSDRTSRYDFHMNTIITRFMDWTILVPYLGQQIQQSLGEIFEIETTLFKQLMLVDQNGYAVFAI